MQLKRARRAARRRCCGGSFRFGRRCRSAVCRRPEETRMDRNSRPGIRIVPELSSDLIGESPPSCAVGGRAQANAMRGAALNYIRRSLGAGTLTAADELCTRALELQAMARR